MEASPDVNRLGDTDANILYVFDSEKPLGPQCEDLVNRILTGDIPFPSTRLRARITPDEAKKELLKYKPSWISMSHNAPRWFTFKAGFPNRFLGKPKHLLVKEGDWFSVDMCVDWYTEIPRLSAKKAYCEPTISSWSNPEHLMGIVLHCHGEKKVTYETLRDGLWKVSPRELVGFRPTRVVALLCAMMGDFEGKKISSLKDKVFFDPCAGWGDRLFAACSLDMIYRGHDVNLKLVSGHTEMIKDLGTPGKQEVIYEPCELSGKDVFEWAKKVGGVDFSISSPPFHALELYDGEKQSVTLYPKVNDWIVKFLFKIYEITWSTLKIRGYMAINISDVRGAKYTEALMLYIQEFMNSTWCGIIPFSGRGNSKYKPAFVYVWRKKGLRDRKKSFSRKRLRTAYPQLHKMLF